MSARATPSSQAGFTLVEVLVALFILSMISTAGVGMLIVTLNGKESLEREAAFLREFETARATLKADLAQVVLRPARDAYGGDDPTVFQGGFEQAGGRALAFVRAGWENPDQAEHREALQYVEYVVEDARLIRRARNRVDPTLDTPVRERVILSGVQNLSVEFGVAGEWTSGWQTQVGVDEGSAMAPDYVAVSFDLEGRGAVRQIFALIPGRAL